MHSPLPINQLQYRVRERVNLKKDWDNKREGVHEENKNNYHNIIIKAEGNGLLAPVIFS